MEIKYSISHNPETGCVFISILEEEYKSVIAKVNNFEVKDEGELEFDMDLPEGCEQYYDDTTFTDKISWCVGDILTKSTNQLYELVLFETAINQMFKDYKIDIEKGPIIKQLADQNIIIYEHEDTLFAKNDDETVNIDLSSTDGQEQLYNEYLKPKANLIIN